MFRPSRTFHQPAQGANLNRGFPAPGAYGQTTGDWSPPPPQADWVPQRPTKGRRSWANAVDQVDVARGFPDPLCYDQVRPGGSVPPQPAPKALPTLKFYPYFSRGDAAYAPQFGGVTYNPIGAGVVAMHRTQASYGPAAQYENGVIFWTSQAIPTSVNLQGLTDPNVLAAVLGPIGVQAAVRVNG